MVINGSASREHAILARLFTISLVFQKTHVLGGNVAGAAEAAIVAFCKRGYIPVLQSQYGAQPFQAYNWLLQEEFTWAYNLADQTYHMHNGVCTCVEDSGMVVSALQI